MAEHTLDAFKVMLDAALRKAEPIISNRPGWVLRFRYEVEMTSDKLEPFAVLEMRCPPGFKTEHRFSALMMAQGRVPEGFAEDVVDKLYDQLMAVLKGTPYV